MAVSGSSSGRDLQQPLRLRVQRQIRPKDCQKTLALRQARRPDDAGSDFIILAAEPLKTLICFKNEMTELNVSKNVALNYLNCATNKLTS